MSRSVYFLILFTFLFCIGSAAQQNRFIYIQTENKQAFYVRINSTVYSSSSAGYLVIPKLKDGAHQLMIGFPRNEWAQQSFTITLNKKDAGYVLKYFGDKGWGLFNLQTMDVLMAKSTAIKTINTANTDIDDDPFTQVLSDVVNTPDLKKKVPVVEEVTEQPKKEEPVVKKEEPVVKKEEPAVKKTEPVVKKEEPAIKKEEPIAKIVVEATSIVKLLVNNKDDKGRVMIYTDESGGIRDTIRLFIPAKSKTVTNEIAKVPPPDKSKEKFIEIELPNPNAQKDTIGSTSTSTSASASASNSPSVTDKPKTFPSVSMVNSDCRANATDEDFMKLRKKMAAAENDEEMVAAAKKGFKSKCYSTSQVKNLCVLFLNDAGRYKFFDAAYPFVYDTGNFGTLEQQLTDPYFITRFQAMIRR